MGKTLDLVHAIFIHSSKLFIGKFKWLVHKCTDMKNLIVFTFIKLWEIHLATNFIATKEQIGSCICAVSDYPNWIVETNIVLPNYIDIE